MNYQIWDGHNGAGISFKHKDSKELTDGGKILGRLPPFTMRSNLFDMFGKDFIGASKHTDIWNKEMLLVKMEAGKLQYVTLFAIYDKLTL